MMMKIDKNKGKMERMAKSCDFNDLRCDSKLNFINFKHLKT